MAGSLSDLSPEDYAALGELRYRIRRFLHFSEAAAHQEGLEPQQHQLLLAVRALGDGEGPTIGMLADHLLVRHHSAVGLIDRLEQRGFVERVRCSDDRRQVRVRLTAEGDEKLRHLSMIHREELRGSGPSLVQALRTLLDRLKPETDGQQEEEDDVSTAQ